eukprot:2375444-Pyramimonas_sp.AAC.1
MRIDAGSSAPPLVASLSRLSNAVAEVVAANVRQGFFILFVHVQSCTRVTGGVALGAGVLLALRSERKDG